MSGRIPLIRAGHESMGAMSGCTYEQHIPPCLLRCAYWYRLSCAASCAASLEAREGIWVLTRDTVPALEREEPNAAHWSKLEQRNEEINGREKDVVTEQVVVALDRPAAIDEPGRRRRPTSGATFRWGLDVDVVSSPDPGVVTQPGDE